MANIEMTKEAKIQLEEYMAMVMELAQIHNIPLFFVAAIDDNGKETEYMQYLHTAQSIHVKLTDDRIRKHVLVEAGFEPVPPRENVTVDMEDLYHG